jgi:Calcineurin-like phosphoesterase
MLIGLMILAATVDPSWISYGPNGPVARTIVTGDCPSITIDQHTHRMRTHAEPGEGYPVRTCEHAIPPEAKSVSIGKTELPVHKLGRTTRVAILGDTGCRRKVGSPAQNCGDPKAWPFARVAESIRAWNPDLIIHVGDYYYREATCDSAGKCVKAPYDWNRWNRDFFTPARELLPNAPWILVRGNHESCDRAAEGYFRFIDPRNYIWENTKTCKSNTDFTPPYSVSVADTEFIVYDSSAAKDGTADPKQVATYAAQFGLLGKAKRDAWLMLHHPIWIVSAYGPGTPTMWTAWDETKPAPPVALAVTGHVHLLELVSFTGATPPLAAIGNGGTALDKAPAGVVGQTVGGRTISSAYVDDDFGWVAAQKNHDGDWAFTVMNEYGRARKACVLKGGALVCD